MLEFSTIVEIFYVRQKGIFFKQFLGWYELKGNYRFAFVGFEYTSIQILYPSL